MAISAVAPAHAQQSRTLKSEMEVIHESLGVNFVYDSAIEINVPYLGKQMKDIIKGNKKEHSALLEECLQTLFAGTGIEYEVMKKYIVLTQADKRKKPKDYTIFIEEQGRGREGESWGGRLSYDPLEAVSITPATFCWSKK